jgi:outer membrane receptor for ferrienterochelin and colicin
MSRPPARALAALAGLLLVAVAPLASQTTGAIAGRVRDAVTGQALRGARVEVAGEGLAAETDSLGAYRLAEVRAGLHIVEVRVIGYVVARFRRVRVLAGETFPLDVGLRQAIVLMDSVVVATAPDPVLDPLATATVQHITAEDLRRLPVTTLEEAVALSAGAVGESYRGGRLGGQSFVLDGLGVKNRLDATTGTLGVRVPPDLLTEAALVTNGFSARYGQAISGMVNVVTRDGGDRWHGRLAYESDRAMPRALDLGFDRFVVAVDGPLVGGVRFVGVVDATGRLDADPVNAPAPPEPLGRRAGNPAMLPHNGGEQYDIGAKLTIPIGQRQTLRLFGLRSIDQRMLFDPAYAYDDAFAPVRRTSGDLLSGHLQLRVGPRASTPLTVDLRGGYFSRDFVRGQLDGDVTHRFGAFTGSRFRVVGEEIARAQDTAAARRPVPGLRAPDYSERSPWGVPAYFLGSGSRGEVSWTQFRELRGQLDVTIPAGRDAEFGVGGEAVTQRVRTFERVLGYRPVGGDVPPASVADFAPLTLAGYAEVQARASDIAFTGGIRYDQFDAHTNLGAWRSRTRRSVSPRFAVSTVLRGATVVVSWGRFSQAPDFQYLVDAAFDDTLRTGRFRRGNPDLGFEGTWQYEFSVRARPSTATSVRVNVFYRRLEGLVASVPFGLDPDSTIFGNTDFGTVKGLEVLAERDLRDGWGARVSYTLQQAKATASDPFQLLQRMRVVPGSTDTVFPSRLEIPLDYDRRHGVTAVVRGQLAPGAGPRVLGVRPVAGLEGAAILRWSSGLPYSRMNSTGDSLVGLPNGYRLPSQSTIDVLLRRPVRIGRRAGSVYLDVRNLLDARNLLALRRDNGQPGLGEAGIAAMAQAAYRAHPEAIPYESPRYRRWADLDQDGWIAGSGELVPLYLAAARDFAQPLFVYGSPRLARVGLELAF